MPVCGGNERVRPITADYSNAEPHFDCRNNMLALVASHATLAMMDLEQ